MNKNQENDRLIEEEVKFYDIDGNQIKSDKKKRSPKKISKKKKSSKPLESEKMRTIRDLRKTILENKDDPNRLVFMEEQMISMLDDLEKSQIQN